MVETVCLVSINEEFGEVPSWFGEVQALFLSIEPLVHFMCVWSCDIHLSKDNSLETVGVNELDDFIFSAGFLTTELVAWSKNNVGRQVGALKLYKRFVGLIRQASLGSNIDDKRGFLLVK